MLKYTALFALLAFVVGIVGAVPETEAKSHPNIVFIYTDDMRYDELAKVPRLAKFASRGTKFTSAYVTNSVCCPSRVTVLTGKYPHNHGVLTNHNNGKLPGGYAAYRDEGLESKNLGVYLQKAGYKTFLGGKFLNGYGHKSPPRGFNAFHRTGSPASDPEVGIEAAEFIGAHTSKGNPVFVAMWLKSPHRPLEYPKEYKGAHTKTPVDLGPSYNDEAEGKHPWVREHEAPPRKELVRDGRKRLRMLRMPYRACASR